MTLCSSFESMRPSKIISTATVLNFDNSVARSLQRSRTSTTCVSTVSREQDFPPLYLRLKMGLEGRQQSLLRISDSRSVERNSHYTLDQIFFHTVTQPA
jgi:hypothetical protein